MSSRHYFAYAPEHDYPAYLAWLNAAGLPWSEWTPVGPSILREHDLVFPTYDAKSSGGRASVQHVPGKRVAGVIYEIPTKSISTLNRFLNSVYGNVTPAGNWHTAAAHRIGDGAEFAVTFYATPVDKGRHVPPASAYRRDLIEFSHRWGHSHGWAMHLFSIATSDGTAEPILYDI